MVDPDHHTDSPPTLHRLDGVENQLRRVSGYCEHLHKKALPDLSAEIARLSAEFAELNARFTAILANQHKTEQPDTTSTDHLGHYEISHQLRSFVEQDLRRAVQQIIPSGTSSIERAFLISRCAEALFKYPEIDQGAVAEIFRPVPMDTAQLEYDTLQRAAEIRQAATDLGHDHRWDFTCEPGTPLDTDTQEPWGVCDPAEPTAFVVVPSYHVSRRLLLKQQVATSAVPGRSTT